MGVPEMASRILFHAMVAAFGGCSSSFASQQKSDDGSRVGGASYFNLFSE